MRILLLTVAGLSSRFSDSLGRPCLKCIYYKNSFEETLLYKMLRRQKYFDKVVIVGGFKYDELLISLKEHFSELQDKIILVENKAYSKYGSGYSFYVGMEAVKELEFDELVFAEGDLFVDDETFKKVCDAQKSVITYNQEVILANRAVALYFDFEGSVHYIYDAAHGSLQINEPFTAIYNSAQIWKFTQIDLLKDIMRQMTNDEKQGTNLVPINKYFQSISGEIAMIGFKKWINCNTVQDFNKTIGGIG